MNPLFILFNKSAETFPHRPALTFAGQSWSYLELLQLTLSKAQEYSRQKVHQGSAVAVCLPKSADSVATLLAILSLGAHYIPLDPKAPAARSALILEEVQPSLVIGLEHLPSAVERSWSKPLHCILYTSGSTGRPKGVMISAEAVLTFVNWAILEVGLTAEDKVVSVAPFYFDLSLFDLFATFAVGAELVIPGPHAHLFPADFLNLLSEHKITTWYSVPTFFMQMLPLLGQRQLDLNKMIFAGEVFPEKGLRRLRKIFAKAQLWNWYGPTETNVITSYLLPQDHLPFPLPLGKVASYAQIEISSQEEILVQGKSLMKGYVHQAPELDAPNLYATGDLGYWDENGLLYFKGRKDSQIKSRGYRIELGEITSVLNSLEGVLEAEVLAFPDPEQGNVMVAFIRTMKKNIRGEILQKLRLRLPAYMIPEKIIELDSFPLNASGKRDLQALPGFYLSEQ